MSFTIFIPYQPCDGHTSLTKLMIYLTDKIRREVLQVNKLEAQLEVLTERLVASPTIQKELEDFGERLMPAAPKNKTLLRTLGQPVGYSGATTLPSNQEERWDAANPVLEASLVDYQRSNLAQFQHNVLGANYQAYSGGAGGPFDREGYTRSPVSAGDLSRNVSSDPFQQQWDNPSGYVFNVGDGLEQQDGLLSASEDSRQPSGDTTIPPSFSSRTQARRTSEFATAGAFNPDVQPGNVRPGNVQPGNVQPGNVQPGNVQPGDVKAPQRSFEGSPRTAMKRKAPATSSAPNDPSVRSTRPLRESQTIALDERMLHHNLLQREGIYQSTRTLGKDVSASVYEPASSDVASVSGDDVGAGANGLNRPSKAARPTGSDAGSTNIADTVRADNSQRAIDASSTLPAEKVFPIQIGSELFRLSGASIASDGKC